MSPLQCKNVIALGIVLFTTAVGGGAPQAKADTIRTGLLVSGSASPHARDLAASTIDAVARESGFPVAKQPFVTREVSGITGCVTALQAWSCAAALVRGKGLGQIAVVSLTNDTSTDGSPMIVITEQIIVASLDATVGAQRFCVRCTDDVLVKSISELTQTLFQEITVRSGRTVVAITSSPRGARITFDGESMGATNRSFNTFPGQHMVVLELDGYQRETRSVDAGLDKTSELSIAMRPLAPVDDPVASSVIATPAEPGTPLGPKLVTAAGAIAVVAGGITLAFDQHAEARPTGSEQRHYYYNTTAPGLGLIIGGAIVGAGGLLWWYYAHTSTAPAVAPVAGGATVGLTKVF